MTLEIHDLAWDRHNNVTGLNQLIRLPATSDKVYQLLAHGRWFSPGILPSSTTKTGRHHGNS
jgi:hypothetical protein